MKISLHWLNSYLDQPCDEAEAERLLTRVGFPIDGREDVTLSGGGQDVMLDVEITSNRGDCLSHVGLAREIAAASGRTLKTPAIELAEAGEPAGDFASVAVDEPGICPLYTARVIQGVKVGPSPQWLIDRLEAVGLRSVNNVVDVTNFVLHELGQPLHAFDLGKLSGNQIVVRKARAKEQFVAIDGSKHDLQANMLVIADAAEPVAVAGVMGGLDSEVGDDTTNILLESAIFEPLAVRATSRALKLSSDSSFRFERGVDPLGVDRASRRAAQLILELAGGTLAAGVIRVGMDEPAAKAVAMRVERCSAILGVDLTADQQCESLSRLGLSPVQQGEQIICTIPSYRLDLKREIDLIEEVARLHGLNRIPTSDKIHVTARPIQNEVAARRHLSQALVAHGYHETITFSFVSPKHGKPFVPADAQGVMIEDERRKAEPMLRPSLLPSLLVCRKSNQDAGNADVQLFEVASTWVQRGSMIEEHRKLTLLRDAADAQQAVRQLRGSLEELVQRLGGQQAAQALTVEQAEHPAFAVAGAVKLAGKAIGVLGILSDEVRSVFDVKTPVAAAELDVAALIELYPPQLQVQPLGRYPAIERDLSVIVSEDVPWQKVEQAVRGAKPAMLEEVAFIGTYRGKQIDKGQKSVSFRMTYRDPDKTLRHDEVDPQVSSVVEALKAGVGAALRG